MKRKTITYWIAALLVVFIMTASGTLAISHTPLFMKALAHLGFPLLTFICKPTSLATAARHSPGSRAKARLEHTF